jgi:hypothetical protein
MELDMYSQGTGPLIPNISNNIRVLYDYDVHKAKLKKWIEINATNFNQRKEIVMFHIPSISVPKEEDCKLCIPLKIH